MKIKLGLEADYAAYVEKNSKDAYSARVVSYAEDWANLMEPRIPASASAAEVTKIIIANADADSHTADTDGITGFMYGCAVSALAHFWFYGEELRKWHNKEYGVDENTKGVVNPAVLTVK